MRWTTRGDLVCEPDHYDYKSFQTCIFAMVEICLCPQDASVCGPYHILRFNAIRVVYREVAKHIVGRFFGLITNAVSHRDRGIVKTWSHITCKRIIIADGDLHAYAKHVHFGLW